MSKSLTLAQLRKQPGKSLELLQSGTLLELSGEEALEILAQTRGVDLRKGAFGRVIRLSLELARGKRIEVPPDLMQQVASGLESDHDLSTQVWPVIVGAAAAGLIIGFGVTYYGGGGSGKSTKKVTVSIKENKGTVTITSGGGSERDEGETDDDGGVENRGDDQGGGQGD